MRPRLDTTWWALSGVKLANSIANTSSASGSLSSSEEWTQQGTSSSNSHYYHCILWLCGSIMGNSMSIIGKIPGIA